MKRHAGPRINPYIATTDVMVSVILVFVLMLAVVSAASGTGASSQRDLLKARIQMLNRAVESLPEPIRPIPDTTRNDPEGTQRWRFSMGSEFFNLRSMQLSIDGRTAVQAFGQVLADTPVWRRIRVEGHAPQTLSGQDEDWEGSVLRAVRVADVLTQEANLNAWCIAVAGRGGQDPVARDDRSPGVNDRVDIIVEFPINDEPCSRTGVRQ